MAPSLRSCCLALCAALTVIASGCEVPPEDPSFDGQAALDEGLATPWTVDSTYSPTGTLLIDGQVAGYAVVDEVCGGDLTAPDYADRFLTPMFRDVAVVDDIAWLVDGSHLWTLDISDPESPVRIGLQAIPGHPVALHASPGGRLWIATIDEGLRGYSVGQDQLIEPAEVQVLLDKVSDRVMDVDGHGSTLAVALGYAGVALVHLDSAGAAVELVQAEAGPWAVGVRMTDARVVTAACDRIWSHQWALDDRAAARAGLALDDEVDFAVPFGSAKNVEVIGDVVYVAAGETMQAYRLGAEPTYLGYWFSDEPGFYVNELVAGDGALYVAAGDQSVRALEVDSVPLAEGTPITWDEPAATIDGPAEAEIPAGSVHQLPKDPIAISLTGDTLLVLGNFRYLGERTLELVDVSTPTWLQPRGTYVQPNRLLGASRLADALVVHGADGDHRVVDVTDAGATVESTFTWDGDVVASLSRGGELYLVPHQGAVVRAQRDGLAVQLEPLTAADVAGRSVALAAGRAFVSDELTDGLLTLDAETGAIHALVTSSEAFLGDAALATHGSWLLAYDRVLGQVLVLDPGGETPTVLSTTAVGLCEAYDIADFYAGAVHARARFLAATEPTLLCPRQAGGASAVLRLGVSDSGVAELLETLALPARTWSDAAYHDGTLALAAFDNNRYVTTVMALDSATGAVRAATDVTGRGNAVEVFAGRVWLVDGDFGLWSFDEASLAPTAAAPLAL